MKLEVFFTDCISFLTPWNTLLLEKLIVAQPVMKFPAFRRSRSQSNRIHNNLPLVSTPDKSYIICLKPIPHSRPKTSKWPLFFRPPTKILYAVSSDPKPTTYNPNSSSCTCCYNIQIRSAALSPLTPPVYVVMEPVAVRSYVLCYLNSGTQVAPDSFFSGMPIHLFQNARRHIPAFSNLHPHSVRRQMSSRRHFKFLCLSLDVIVSPTEHTNNT
jgi:hypothetical protein